MRARMHLCRPPGGGEQVGGARSRVARDEDMFNRAEQVRQPIFADDGWRTLRPPVRREQLDIEVGAARIECHELRYVRRAGGQHGIEIGYAREGFAGRAGDGACRG